MMIAKADPPSDDNEGGKGGVLETHVRRELRLIGRAVREGWPIKKSRRRNLVDMVYDRAMNSVEERTQIHAAQVLAKMHADNIRLMALDQADEHHAKGTKVTHEHVGTVTVDARRAELAGLLSASHDRRGSGESPRTDNGPSVIDAG